MSTAGMVTRATALSLILTIALPMVALSQSNDDAAGTTTTSTQEAELAATSQWFATQNVPLQGRNFNDFVVSPGKFELTMQPGETRVVEISVANRLDDNRTFKIDVEDFVASNNLQQSVNFLGDEYSPYTLKDYVSTPEDNFQISRGTRALIPVTISIPEDAEPGGRYGSVFISTVRNRGGTDSTSSAAPSSPLITRVGTLFFVTVPGDIEYQGELKQFALTNDKLWYESGPIDFGIVYENNGTVHVSPYGELEINNLFGEAVGFLEIDPWFALPNSLRLKELSWDREVLFGRYTATLRLNRGYDDIIDESSVTFWVLPWKVMLVIFVTVFIVVFVIRFFIRNFEFKRKS